MTHSLLFVFTCFQKGSLSQKNEIPRETQRHEIHRGLSHRQCAGLLMNIKEQQKDFNSVMDLHNGMKSIFSLKRFKKRNQKKAIRRNHICTVVQRHEELEKQIIVPCLGDQTTPLLSCHHSVG